MKTKFLSSHTADSKPVKQEVNGTVILPRLVFLALSNTLVYCRTLLTIVVKNYMINVIWHFFKFSFNLSEPKLLLSGDFDYLWGGPHFIQWKFLMCCFSMNEPCGYITLSPFLPSLMFWHGGVNIWLKVTNQLPNCNTVLFAAVVSL
jgi:hypothetical protein